MRRTEPTSKFIHNLQKRGNMVRSVRSGVAAGAVLALVATAAACSSSSSGGSNNNSSSSSNARGVTDTEITIGGIASLTSPQGAVFPGADIGAKAAFEAVNRAGGINGRKIKYVDFQDDGLDASKNMAAVQKLVLQDKVFGIVPITSEVFQPAASDFLLKNKVPFTGFGFQPGFCGNDAGFGFNGCLVGSANNGSTVGPLTKVLPKGSSLALVMDDASSGTSALKQIKAAAQYYGYKVVYGKAVLPVGHPITDFTPYTSAIVKSHPDAVYTDSGTFANVVGLDGALKAAGYKGPTVNFSTYSAGLLNTASVAKAIDGAYVNIQFAPPEEGGPAIDQIKKDLEAIGEKPEINLGVATSYWSAELMIAMLKEAGPDLNPDTFLQKINSGFTWTPDPAGGVGPESFPAAHNDPTPCAAMVQVKGTQYVSAAKFDCYKILR